MPEKGRSSVAELRGGGGADAFTDGQLLRKPSIHSNT